MPDSQSARDRGEWKQGYTFGFEDNHIPHWRRRFYSAAFISGYDAGKNEIDLLVDEAVEYQQRCGEWE